VAIVGANGAGKSTILKSIAGLQSLQRGTVTFLGRDVTGWSSVQAVKAGVVLCPEGRQLFPQMTIRENLELGLGAGRPSKQEIADRFAEVEALFPFLQSRLRQQAGTLSGGEQQMVALGRALMSRPQLLILDEPSLGLAPLLVEQVFATIRQIVDAGRTVLLAEQNVEASLEIADRAYVLEAGEIVSSGDARTLLRSPVLLRAFLGDLADSDIALGTDA
jgi:ABC-type branched-subunit amino acid transport system ATPase component